MLSLIFTSKIQLDIIVQKRIDWLIYLLCLMPLSAISWRPALVVEEAGVPRENHQP